MDMKNIIKAIIISALSIGFALQLQAIRITPAVGPYTVGQTILFYGSSAVWDFSYVRGALHFGDGDVYRYAKYSTPVSHRYTRPGTYTVQIIDEQSSTPFPTETMTLTIVEIRKISFTPLHPYAGQTITFTAENFATPKNIRWDFGDGVIITSNQDQMMPQASHQVSHAYTKPGNYLVRAYDWDGTDSVPITLRITIGEPARSIISDIETPREDQPVQLQAINFLSQIIDWNLGDGTLISGAASQTHRFMRGGQITISALDRTYTQTPTTITLTVLPENRSITSNLRVARINQPVAFTAQMFRGNGVLWDFADGTSFIGSHQESHIFSKAGNYTISARDESGRSQRVFTTDISVQGINDEVTLHKAELRFDNGRAYRIVPRNSQHLQAELQMKMEGTGLITGFWVLDGQIFKPFSQMARQGDIALIKTGLTPPLPTIDPGLHKLTVQLTRPQTLDLPEIAYFVEPMSAQMDKLEPVDGYITQEDSIPQFIWEPVRGAAYYEISFADTLYNFLYHPDHIQWQPVRTGNSLTPNPLFWLTLTRNRTLFWQVRAKDSAGQLISQSEPRAIEIKLNPARIVIDSITDTQNNRVSLPDLTLPPQLMIRGTITFPGEGKFLMMRVFADEKMVNQLMFRDLSPGQSLPFTTSVPTSGIRRVTLQVLKPTTPAVIVGVHHLDLRRR
jgi:PKD repeat protein